MQYREAQAFVEFLRSVIYKLIDINFIISTSFGNFYGIMQHYKKSLHNLLSLKKKRKSYSEHKQGKKYVWDRQHIKNKTAHKLTSLIKDLLSICEWKRILLVFNRSIILSTLIKRELFNKWIDFRNVFSASKNDFRAIETETRGMKWKGKKNN